jgi:hypothetical protein
MRGGYLPLEQKLKSKNRIILSEYIMENRHEDLGRLRMHPRKKPGHLLAHGDLKVFGCLDAASWSLNAPVGGRKKRYL